MKEQLISNIRDSLMGDSLKVSEQGGNTGPSYLLNTRLLRAHGCERLARMRDRDDVSCGHWCLRVVSETDRLTENNTILWQRKIWKLGVLRTCSPVPETICSKESVQRCVWPCHSVLCPFLDPAFHSLYVSHLGNVTTWDSISRQTEGL